MEYPVTQLWDSRLLYVYAMFGGYFKPKRDTLSFHINRLINDRKNRKYITEILAKLEFESRIRINEIRVSESSTELYQETEVSRKLKSEFPAPSFRILYSRSVPNKLHRLLAKLEEIKPQYIELDVYVIDAEWFKTTVNSYVTSFRKNDIFYPKTSNPTLYEQRKLKVLTELGKQGNTKLITGRQLGDSERFLETILAMADEGLVEIYSFSSMMPDSNDGHGIYRAKIKHIKPDLQNQGDQHNTDSQLLAGSDYRTKLSMSGKVVRILYKGDDKIIKTFNSVKNDNYKACRALFDSPNEPLTKTQMGLEKTSTVVKDMPKTMGFKGSWSHIFLSYDTKNQTITLHPSKSLTSEEAAIVKAYVNS